ncbi:DeoxyUTP pyrophosphatase [Niveomyces insectorum RCEF 264]|uniref:Deoxyuridine 5'-triphosphate nucleotidohydrolase n=1 Tax=Niveomyces insectorum RCEF 264 TaxID=1081102 RepID=A0A168A0M1_9HYPO|nr:DeoxyUTP pyrophosphatase [Niveomyces insectorum RCEF 264]
MTTDDATAPPPTASSPVVVPVVTSPPTSPPAKRVKTTMADIEPQPPAAAASDPPSTPPPLRPPPPPPPRPTLGTYGRVAPRSGLAAKHGINTGAGVIDADYRGPVRVLLFNHRDQDFAIAAGDRVAQLVLERIVTPDVVELPELPASVRGAGGVGSTIDAPGGAGGTIV